MTTYSPLAVKYPVVTEQGKDYTDLEKLLDDLDTQSQGFYLIGRNNCWHGGIHITDEKFAHHKTTYPVRCMMDGTVVAYCLNQNYPTLSWQPNATVAAKDARYSNGFVLVRHDYGTPKNTEEGADKDKQNTLTLYSLYMHTADYHTYVSAATDTQKTVTITRNTNARSAADVTQIAGVLKQGSTVQLDTAQDPRLATSQGTTYKFYVVTLMEKASGSDEALTVGDTYYLYAGCFPVGTFPESTQKALPSYWKGTITGKTKVRMWVYTSQADCDEHDKAKAVILNSGQTVTFQSSDVQKSTDGKHSMANCQIASGATFAGHTQMTSGWMYVDENQIERQSLVPTQFDSIVTCDYPIKAGETIGFMGIWDRPTAPLASGELASDYQMHVELFTTDDKAALDKFLQNDAHLKTGKKYLKVPKNTVLYSSDDHGGFVAVHNSLFTSQDYLFEESTLTQEKDRSNTVYYKLKGIRTGEAAIGPVDLYYVKPGGNVKLVTQYDLEELGYTTIEETDSSTNCYIDPDKVPSDMFKTIFDEINSNHDDKYSGEEVKAFLQSDKYLRDKLFKLVAGHPSEWHRTTQNNLKTLVNRLIAESTQEETKKLNQFEIDRFEKCEFASQISGLTQKLWHFHPIMVSSYIKEKSCSVLAGQITYNAEGNDIPGNHNFTRVIHWPGNDESGVTIGRGYDLGSRSYEDIVSDLTASGVPENQARKIANGAGLKGGDAHDFVVSNKNDIGEITLDNQINLFNLVYPRYVEAAISNYNHWTSTVPTRYEWDTLDQVIRDILVDFVYQGFTKGPKPMESGMNNSKDEMIEYINSSTVMLSYEAGRHRVQYLESN